MSPKARVVACAAVLVCVASSPRSQQPQLRGTRSFAYASEADVLQFEGLPKGTILTSVMSRGGAGPVLVRGFNPLLGDVNAAVIFDTAMPTGGDFDLGTPNQDFGGPGIGNAGGKGSPFANASPKGNVPIVAANLDTGDDDLVDDPNDVAVEGAMLEFDFSPIGYATFYGLTVLDVEVRDPAAMLELVNGAGRTLLSTPLPVVGDNGITQMTVGPIEEVVLARVILNGSGSIDDIVFSPPADASIVGFIWDDLDKNGIQDEGEPGLAGVTVELFNAGESGVPVASSQTMADGIYSFNGLSAGNYEVRVNAETLPDLFRSTICMAEGSTPDNDSNCSPAIVNLLGIETVTDIDFGYTDDPECEGVIGDFIFYDSNSNNVQDPGEPGLENVFVFLRDADNMIVATDTTGPDGMYQFTDLCLGDYTVEVDISEVLPPPGVGLVTLGPVLCEVGFDNTVDSECGPRGVRLLAFLTPTIDPQLSIDWGFGDCGECVGGLNGLSLRYIGPFPASLPAEATEVHIRVVQLDGAIVFDDMVTLGQDFSFMGTGVDMTFGSVIRVQVAGSTEILLDTTCETGVQPGDTFPQLQVQAGSSADGGFLCLTGEGGGEGE